MNYVRSKILSSDGVAHGFGVGAISLNDHLNLLGIKDALFFKTNQMHSDNIVILTSSTDPSCRGAVAADEAAHENAGAKLEADAFVTHEPGIVCYVRTADCVPILMLDPVKRVVAAVHAGWRGTALSIVTKVVEMLEKEYNSNRKEIRAAIGPAISGECYEVGEEVIEQMPEFILRACREDKFYVSRLPLDVARGRSNSMRINLPAINRQLLLNAGLQHIDIIPICNHCDTRFVSYRRDKNEAGRQVNFISIVE